MEPSNTSSKSAAKRIRVDPKKVDPAKKTKTFICVLFEKLGAITAKTSICRKEAADIYRQIYGESGNGAINSQVKTGCLKKINRKYFLSDEGLKHAKSVSQSISEIRGVDQIYRQNISRLFSSVIKSANTMLVDDREQDTSVFANMRIAELPFDKKRLPVGDYCFVKKIGDSEVVCTVVERKSVMDMYSSLNSNRFHDQLRRLSYLCDNFNVNVVFLIQDLGEKNPFAVSIRWRMMCALAEVGLFTKISIVFCFDVIECTNFFISTYNSVHQGEEEGEEEGEEGEGKKGTRLLLKDFLSPSENEYSARTAPTVGSIWMEMLLQLPSITSTKADMIVGRFPTPRSFYNALQNSREYLKEYAETLKRSNSVLSKNDAFKIESINKAVKTDVDNVYSAVMHNHSLAEHLLFYIFDDFGIQLSEMICGIFSEKNDSMIYLHKN